MISYHSITDTVNIYKFNSLNSQKRSNIIIGRSLNYLSHINERSWIIKYGTGDVPFQRGSHFDCGSWSLHGLDPKSNRNFRIFMRHIICIISHLHTGGIDVGDKGFLVGPFDGCLDLKAITKQHKHNEFAILNIFIHSHLLTGCFDGRAEGCFIGPLVGPFIGCLVCKKSDVSNIAIVGISIHAQFTHWQFCCF